VKDTLTNEQNESLIAEMLRDAKTVELPSELAKNPIVSRGSDDEPPMTVKELSSAGYVYVYDTRTFQRIPVLKYMLPSKMRQRREDGSFRFTTNDPGQKPIRGTIKCMLHKDSEQRKHFDELGFRPCKKDNITNQYQLEQHMAKKHRAEWATIKAEKAATEREEDRAIQRLILQGRLNSEPKWETPTPVVKKVIEPVKEPEPIEDNRVEVTGKYICTECGKEVSTSLALAGHKRSHKK
jgi:hypothetical protein